MSALVKFNPARATQAVLSALLFVLVASPAYSQSPPATLMPPGHYNEIFDEAGRVRPHYREVYEISRGFSQTRMERMRRESRRSFRGDNALNPIPRILLDSEYDLVLKPGVEQRGRALRAFLQDHYSGRKEYIRAGLVPQDVMTRIIARNLESGYEGRVDPSQISFPYGPDVIRDAQGHFRVVEDNSGFVGGFGDLEKALETLFEIVPEYRGRLNHRNPADFYAGLVARFRERANGGRVAIFMVPPYADNEDARIQRIMRNLDVDVITPHTRNKLKVQSDGLYVEKPVAGGRTIRQKIGFLAVNGEHWWLDARHPVVEPIAITEVARGVESDIREIESSNRTAAQREFLEIMAEKDPRTGFPDLRRIESSLRAMDEWEEVTSTRRSGVDGLMNAILNRQVAVNFTPGTNFTNDKEFYLYVEDFVRFYLREEPILKNIETHRVGRQDRAGGRIVADEALLTRAAAEQDKWVIKIVDGRGGDGITVGPKVSREVFNQAIERARQEPGRTIIQAYTPLSVVGRDIVDVRVLSDVAPTGRVFVSDTPWGRALPLAGDGRVNLSALGRETTVIITAAAPYCQTIFASAR